MAVDNFARALAAKAIAGSGAGSSSSGSSSSGSSSSGSSGSVVQVQADCNIVDETNPAFIKNKPWEMDYQTVFTQDALDNYAQVAPGPTGKFVPGIDAQIQIDSVPIVKDKTYYVKCSSDQGIVEYTGKAIEIQDGSIALGDVDFSSDNPSTETISIAIVMNAEFGEAMIMILFNNLASANESDVPTLTNVSLTIQEVVVTKKISSDYIDLPENNQIQADWNTADELDPSFIKNKPTTLEQVQADWNTADESDPSFIKNKPCEGGWEIVFSSQADKGSGAIYGEIIEPYINFVIPDESIIIEGKTYLIQCSSDQSSIESTCVAHLNEEGIIVLSDYDPLNPAAQTVSFIGGTAQITIYFPELAVTNSDNLQQLTNIVLVIQELNVIKKIPYYLTEHIQSNWNATDETDASFIKNKPDIPKAYMIYKSKYDNGDYEMGGSITGKPIYEAVHNGSVIYYVDDSSASYYTNTYYPMTSIWITQPCGGKSFNIECTYTSWEYDTSSKTYVCTRNTLNMGFRNT